MKSIERRLQELQDKAAQQRAQREHEGGALERINARLDAIGQRLRANGVVLEVDANEIAQRFAAFKESFNQ